MPALEDRVDALENGHRTLDGRVGTLEKSVSSLREDLAELRIIVPTLATKVDLSKHETSMGAKIDSAINGVLRDALNSVPARYAAVSLASLLSAALGLFAIVHYVR